MLTSSEYNRKIEADKVLQNQTDKREGRERETKRPCEIPPQSELDQRKQKER